MKISELAHILETLRAERGDKSIFSLSLDADGLVLEMDETTNAPGEVKGTESVAPLPAGMMTAHHMPGRALVIASLRKEKTK